MLQNIGDSLKGKKFLAWLILIPLVLVFAIWGATGAVNFDLSGARSVAASGDGVEVEFDRANRIWQDELSLFQQQTGTEPTAEIPDAILDQTLERLIVGELIAARAQDMGYAVTERAIYEAIQSETAFQVEGRYSESLALARLSQLGLSPEQYRADIRKDLRNRELQRSLFLSEFVTPGELGRLFALEGEQRQVAYLTLEVDSVKRQVRVSEADLLAWFEKNKDQYQIPQKVSLRYLVLSFDEVKNQVVVSEPELAERYRSQLDRFMEPERRKSRHILLETEAAARDVLGKLKSGSDFGELAKSQSKDTGSAASGGDLGWADRSAFVKPFADKLFAMKAGELSDPVKTEFGYHVIKLESVQPEVVKSLAEVRAVVEDGIRTEKATEIFAEREDQLQTILQQQSNLALPALAQKIQLPVQELTTFSRGQPSPLGPSAEFDEVVFSDAVLNRRQISRPITIGEDRLMVVQVIDSQPSTFEKFESVREKVRDAATVSKAAELLRNTVDKLVSDINSVDDLTSKVTNFKGRFQSSRFIDRTDPSVPLKLRRSVFESNRPKADKPVVGSVILDNGDAAVFVATDSRNVADTLDPATRSARIRQGITLSGQATLASYVNDLRATSNVEKNVQGFQ